MDLVIMGMLGAGVGIALFLVIAAVRGVSLFGGRKKDDDGSTARRTRSLTPTQLSLSVAVALGVWLSTGWPVAGLGLGVGAVVLPRVFGGRAARAKELRKIDAIASWADLIRDTISGAAGIEQAIIQSARNAPPAIAIELAAASRNLEVFSLEQTLRQLAEDLDHPSADLVIVSLIHAAGHEAANLSEVLDRLSFAIRGDVRMRTRIEVGRARLRTAALWTTLISVLVSVYLVVFAPDMLAGYDSWAGQAWLVVVFAVYGAAIWLFQKQAQLALPERFRARRQP